MPLDRGGNENLRKEKIKMKICDDNHDEIVFKGSQCPLCFATNRIEFLENKLEKIEEATK